MEVPSEDLQGCKGEQVRERSVDGEQRGGTGRKPAPPWFALNSVLKSACV